MGEIIFEGEPPYEQLIAISAKSSQARRGVVLTLNVTVDGLPTPTVPIQVLMAPSVARELANIATDADVVATWWENGIR